MALARTSVSTFQSSAAAFTLAPGAGAAAGNLGIIVVETANQAISTPTGWSLFYSDSFGTVGAATGLQNEVYRRTSITSGEASTGVSISDSGDHQSAAMLTYSGHDTTTPTIATTGTFSTSTSSTSVVSSANPLNASDVKNGDICLAIIVTDRDSASAATITSPAWAGATGTRSTPVNGSTATGAGGGIIVDEFVVTADATGPVSFSCTITGSAWDMLLVVVKAPASGTTVALTGQSLTAALGSLLASTVLALTGQSLNVAQGTIGIGAALSGQSLSVSQGSIALAISAVLSGQSATVAQGTLSPSTAISLTGQASSVAQGSVTQSRSIALSGQGTAVAQGSVSPAISVAIGGQSLVVAQGTVVAVTGITAALTGQSLSVAQGSVAPALSLAISGQAISVAGGSLVPVFALAITGQALTTASGLVSVLASTDVTRALTGQSISIALGSITASVTDEHYKFWRQPPLTGRRTSPGRSR